MKAKRSVGCLIVGIVGLIIIAVVYLTSSYNNMVKKDEEVKEKWSQVENVYQRRMDLIPNLVETVKGYARQEKETFIAVAEARSKAKGTFNVSEEVLNNHNRALFTAHANGIYLDVELCSGPCRGYRVYQS